MPCKVFIRALDVENFHQSKAKLKHFLFLNYKRKINFLLPYECTWMYKGRLSQKHLLSSEISLSLNNRVNASHVQLLIPKEINLLIKFSKSTSSFIVHSSKCEISIPCMAMKIKTERADLDYEWLTWLPRWSPHIINYFSSIVSNIQKNLSIRSGEHWGLNERKIYVPIKGVVSHYAELRVSVEDFFYYAVIAQKMWIACWYVDDFLCW